MKNSGSESSLRQLGYRWVSPDPAPFGFSGQSLSSRLVVIMVLLFLTAVFIDGPMRDMAQSLDPSVKAWVQLCAGIGNSTWPILFGLIGLCLLFLLGRLDEKIDQAILGKAMSVLTLLVISVMTSGFLASLSKNIIGRIRPSTDVHAQVLDFSVLAFRSGWAAFPSGHSTTAMAAATALAICFPRFAWAWLAIGGLGALARALAGVHWLSDCLAGAVLGAAVTLLLHRSMQSRGHQFDTSAETLLHIFRAFLRLIQRMTRKRSLLG